MPFQHIHWATIERRITIIKFWKHKGTEQGFCYINREKVTNVANALYVNIYFLADALYMHVNSHVICKIESVVFAVVENDMTLFPIEREMQLKSFVDEMGLAI